MTKIKTAIVGCGAVSRLHISALLQDPRFELAALVDPSPEALDRTCLEFQVAPACYANVADLGSVDAAIVAVPPYFHLTTVCALLERSIHVLCEKPMGISVAEATDMVEAAANSSAVLRVGFMKRYAPNTRLLQRAIARAYVGEVERFTLVDGSRTDWDSANPHRFNPQRVPGGVLYESGIHWLDRLIYLLGEPTVLDYQDDRLGGVEANAQLRASFVRWERVLTGEIRLSWTEAWGSYLEVVGSEGRLRLEDGHPDGIAIIRRFGNQEEKLMLPSDEDGAQSLFQAQLEGFLRAMTGADDGVLGKAEDARRALRLIEEAYSRRQPMDQPWVYSGLLRDPSEEIGARTDMADVPGHDRKPSREEVPSCR